MTSLEGDPVMLHLVTLTPTTYLGGLPVTDYVDILGLTVVLGSCHLGGRRTLWTDPFDSRGPTELRRTLWGRGLHVFYDMYLSSF